MCVKTPKRRRLLARVLSVLLASSPLVTLAPATYADGGDCNCGSSSTDLIAGGGNEASALDVGEVIVSNCADSVCVEYSLSDDAIAEGWVITETHAAIGATEDDIPQTKKGSPIPGQFEHNESHDNVTSFTVCFDNTYAPGDEIVVAAHAVVVKPTDDWGMVWQIGAPEGTLENGLPTNYADEFNWGFPADEATAGPGLAQERPLFANPFVVNVNVDSEFPYNSNFDKDYATNFDIEWTGALPFGGRLLISWSPGQSAREVKTITFAGQSQTFIETGAPTPGGFLDRYPLAPLGEMYVGALPEYTHVININHSEGDGTFYDWIRLEQPGLHSETAWGDGDRFVDKGNWATYITYTIEDCCTEAPASADATVTNEAGQGQKNNGGNVLSQRSVLDSVKTDNDVNLSSSVNTGFYSLGFGGDIVIEFPCPVVNGEGPDLRVIETTSGASYPKEQADVFAWDGGWVHVGTVSNQTGTGLNRPDEVDLDGSGVSSSSRFKIVDTTLPGDHNGNADGYDVQYIEALNGACCP